MKCIDNKKMMNRQKRQRIIRFMWVILLVLCTIAGATGYFKYIHVSDKTYAFDYETAHYNTAFYSTNLFSEDLCVSEDDVAAK